jgi:cell division protein FtsA
MTLEPIASAMAVLSDEEKEAGVALVDIGGGTTDITIFYEGIIRHTAVVPFGGNVITKDVKEGCTVMQHQAEKLKVKFGSALAEEVFDNRIITIPGLNNREHKEISEKNLALIIQARMEEILDYALWEIRRSGFEKKLIGGIVLTGGGSLLRDLDKLCEYHTGMITRIGIPIEHLAHGYDEQVCSPIYATGIGLLMKAADQQTATSESFVHIQPVENQNIATEKIENTVTSDQEEDSDERRQGWLESMFKKTKEWFEAEPDKDF